MARSDFRDLAKAIVRLPDQSTRTKPKPFDTSGIVKRIDGKTAYVKFKGSEEETPVNISVACSVGDDVRVRVDGRKAFIIGNTTAPPTDDKLAKVARTQAVYAGQEAANAALDAKIAQEKANIAEMEATNAASAAESARSMAENVNQYFWYKNDETGYDTEAGAHVTEVPQEQFEDNPEGGNILIRSQYIKFRMALNTLSQLGYDGYKIFEPTDSRYPVAQFLSTGTVLGKTNEAHTISTSTGTKYYYDSDSIGSIKYIKDAYNPIVQVISSLNDNVNDYSMIYLEGGNTGSLNQYIHSDLRSSNGSHSSTVSCHSMSGFNTLDNSASLRVEGPLSKSAELKVLLDSNDDPYLKWNDHDIFITIEATGSGSVTGDDNLTVSCTGTIPSGYKPIAVSGITTNHTSIGKITRFTTTNTGASVTIRNDGGDGTVYNYSVTAYVLCSCI